MKAIEPRTTRMSRPEEYSGRVTTTIIPNVIDQEYSVVSLSLSFSSC